MAETVVVDWRRGVFEAKGVGYTNRCFLITVQNKWVETADIIDATAKSAYLFSSARLEAHTLVQNLEFVSAEKRCSMETELQKAQRENPMVDAVVEKSLS